MDIQFDGDKELTQKLKKLSNLSLQYSVNRSLVDIAARAGQKYINQQYAQGYTPYDPNNRSTVHLITTFHTKKATGGKRSEGSGGYSIHYAPHVEYGHRLRNGGYVPGQRFLKRNIDKQKLLLQKYASDQLRKG